MPDAFDRDIILWVNQFAQQSRLLDGGLVLVEQTMLMKGGMMVALIWWAWGRTRGRLIGDDLFWPKTIIGTVLMVAIARGLQNLLPERLRPMHESSLGFQPLHFQDVDQLLGWSSFPSDHAVLFAGLAAAIFKADRSIGWLAALWSVVVIFLPRVALGLHYPSDIVVGAAIGVAIMLGVHAAPLAGPLLLPLQRLEDRHRGLLYAAVFLFSLLTASLFDDIRIMLFALDKAFAV